MEPKSVGTKTLYVSGKTLTREWQQYSYKTNVCCCEILSRQYHVAQHFDYRTQMVVSEPECVTANSYHLVVWL